MGIIISLNHFGISSSQRFRGLPLGRLPIGWVMSVLLWEAVGAILLTCDHHLIVFLFDIHSDGCMFTRRLISSVLVLSILVFPAAFLRHLTSVVVSICLSLLVRVPCFTLVKYSWREHLIYYLCLGGHADCLCPRIGDIWLKTCAIFKHLAMPSSLQPPSLTNRLPGYVNVSTFFFIFPPSNSMSQ